jgi:histidinol phosphatase-like enzyme
MSDKKINKDRVCFVPGCKTGYFSNQKFNKVTVEINPSLFKALNVVKLVYLHVK